MKTFTIMVMFLSGCTYNYIDIATEGDVMVDASKEVSTEGEAGLNGI